VNIFIALAKGELAEGVERYVGRGIKVSGRPLLTQCAGKITYRIINARDVPRFTPSYDFGISGLDYCEDERLADNGNSGFKYLDELDFGRGWLVLYSKSMQTKRNPRIAMPRDLQNLGGMFMDKLFGGEWTPLVLNGATEGFVSSEEACLGFDFMSDKNADAKYEGTIKRNGLIVLDKLMPTQAMLIGKPEYTREDFLKLIRGD